MAAQFLWVASGRQYGACPRTVRPCGDECNSYTTYWGPSNASLWVPYLQPNGQWINCKGGCQCASACDCCTFCFTELEGPVASVTQVKVDGVVINPSEYFIVDERKLVRHVGCFPKCQSIQATSAETGTFEVTYLQGRPLDAAGQAVLDILACEFLSSCTGGSCRLPSRWQSLNREGISMQAFDDFRVLDAGRVGIFEVDQWLATVNPSGNLYPSFIPKMDGRPKLVEQTWP